MIKLKIILLMLAFIVSSSCNAVQVAMTTDSKVKLDVSLNAAKQLVFSVTYSGEKVIEESHLGLNIDNNKLGGCVKQLLREASSTYGYVSYNIIQNDGHRLVLDTRVFDDGIALRYRIPTEGPVCIYDEQTTFVFPSKTQVWYASGPFQYGYIQAYQERLTDRIEGELLAPPATFRLPSGVYAAITEANLFNYHGAVLLGTAPNSVQFGYVENEAHVKTGTITGIPSDKYVHNVVRGVPWTVSPRKGEKEIVTPWRVLMLSNDLNGLVNNRIISKVSTLPDPTLFPNGVKTDWIKPSRASFAWLMDGDNRLSLANHKKYVDGCAKLGIETVVVDDGWELWHDTDSDSHGRDKWAMMKELVDYAKTKNVNIWVWRPSSKRSGNNTDIGILDPDERERFMTKCNEVGIKGLKIDFFHTENLFTVNFMEDILRDAARHKLLVIYHGVNKPTGDSFTYPNLLAKEAVRGLECVGGEKTWAPGPAWPYHNTVLPFTRWLAGPADYTPLNFRSFCSPEVTFGFQISSIYMYNSPMLIFAADIDDMLNCPARTFIENVPVEWDETIVQPESKIGEVAVLARRKGNIWYLTVVNGMVERLLTTSLNFLPRGSYRMEMATDTPFNRRSLKMVSRKVRSGQQLREQLMSGGGFVARFVPVK